MTERAQPDERDVRLLVMTKLLIEAGAKKVHASISRGGTMTVDVEAGEGNAERKPWRTK